MEYKKRILITGPVPPPAGGISIHIWRLKYLLQDEYELDFIDESSIMKKGIFNIRSYNPFAYLNKIIKADLIYVQSGSTYLRLFQLLMAKCFFKKIILTLHSYPSKKNKILYFIDSSIFNFAKQIIVVNENILPRISLPVEKCIIKNAFLPPLLKNEPELPEIIVEFLEKAKAEGKTIICSNASRLDLYNNEDLYGMDMCLEVTQRMNKKGVPVFFIFIVSSIDSKNIYENYSAKIKDLQIEDTFLLLNIKLSFVKLIQQANIVVRPTNTDGDALTVREALFMNKIILASDVVIRPVGTHLFKNRDVNDFENKLEELIQQNKLPQQKVITDENNSFNEYRLFYTNLINSVLKN